MTTADVGTAASLVVMAGLVPAIHVFETLENKTWMPGTRPGMTSLWEPRSSLRYFGFNWLMTAGPSAASI
jgi:hypothetical protein